MGHDPATQRAEHEREHGGGAGAVHVVVAEHAHGLAGLHGAGEPVRRGVHVTQSRGIRQQGAQRRLQEMRRRVAVGAARGEQPAEHVRQVQPLGDVLRDPVLTLPPEPPPAAQAPFYAERGLGA